MFYHSKYSNDFVGLRTTLGGGKQIVWEINDGSRVLLNICDLKFLNTQIDEALKEGITAKSVFGGIMSALNTRNILVDIAS
tara:strand:+ start:63 stop:305 length:243 start_codon:yes stop_codon:yes gene_type:complete